MVDDNPPVRQALCEAFKREADFDVCGEAENGREGIDQANSLQPDVIVMDFSMPVLNGLEAVRLLNALMPRVVVHQNLPRTEKAVNPCPLCPRTFDVLLSHSANRVDPNPTKKEGWGAKTTNEGACPEMKSR